MASRPSSPPASLPALTGLRGVAAVWVVLFHIQNRAPDLGLPTWVQASLLAHGWIAVDVFFILSGFVLMHAHGLEFESVRAESLRRFAIQRFLRVYPTATAVLALILALTIADPAFVAYGRKFDTANFTPAAFLKTLALAGRWLPGLRGDWNWPTWSLSVEIVGYVAFPWLAALVLRIERGRTALLGAAFCLAALACANHLGGRTDFNDIGMWAYVRMACCFAGGVCLAQARRLAPTAETGRSAEWALLGVVGLAFACSSPGCMALASPCAALLVLALSFGGGSAGRALSSPVALWLGRISFPLYLVHVVPLFWLESHVRAAHATPAAVWACLAAYLVFCAGTAWALHRLVERPTHRLARRLAADHVKPFDFQTDFRSPPASCLPS